MSVCRTTAPNRPKKRPIFCKNTGFRSSSISPNIQCSTENRKTACCKCCRKGAGAIAFTPLAQGLLSTKYLNGIPAGSRAADVNSPFLQAESITEDVLGKVRKLNQVAAERGQSLPQMAIAWLLKDPRVTSVLIGASKTKQIEENAAALKSARFSAEELDTIDKILS
ncbi:aldo/keto reductase [Bacillus paralicheniformis]|uniref:aldo/keto reductase n=1 Tax=Bacillus paralicheniformis TaxID=1648923 RepID=UPI0031400B62